MAHLRILGEGAAHLLAYELADVLWHGHVA
jgi:hypothetical protein